MGSVSRTEIFILLIMYMVFIPSLCQLQHSQASRTQVLLQIRKQLEYPIVLDIWANYTGDICNIPSTSHVTLTCQDNSVIELRIMGDKTLKVSGFNGYSIPNQTLSSTFSIDSLVTTLTRLTSLRILSLVNLGIWGVIPDKIHRLDSLELLDLSSNYLFGPIPKDISRLAKLQILSLDGNYLNGSVPDVLDTLSNLTVLSCNNNKLEGMFPSSLCSIKALTNIALSKNRFSGKLPDLSTLSGLHVLDLIDNRLDSELPGFPKGLVTVLLSRNLFTGYIHEQFRELTQLQHLDFSFNLLTGTPPSVLFALPNISYIDLSSNMLSGSLSGDLHCGSKLGFVDISNNKLIGNLPPCLNITSDKPVVKYGGNCLSIGAQHQHPKSFCQKNDVKKKPLLEGKLGILIAAAVGVCLIAVLLLLGCLIFCRKARPRRTLEQHTMPKIGQDSIPTGVSSQFLANARFISEASKIGTQGAPFYRIFALEELKEVTNNFNPSALMGEGSIGKLYKGRLDNGTYVAVRSLALLKKFHVQNLKVRLDLLSKFHHPHLVGLLGHCFETDGPDDSNAKVFLVYEYVQNGNYRSHLAENYPENVLNWSDRLAILIGVAKAVHFLHTGVIPPSFNNRLKTNNILLDEHNIAKLSDYGISILTDESDKPEVKGGGKKSGQRTNLGDDVYNFGFILLESLVGPIVTGKGEAFLLNEMASFSSQDGRRRIVDPIVLTTSSQESLSTVISITNKCIAPDPSTRPSFEDVLWNLQYAAQVQATADADQRSDATSQS